VAGRSRNRKIAPSPRVSPGNAPANAPANAPVDAPAAHSPLVSPRTERILLGAILVIGALLRLWYLSQIVNAPDFRAPQQDPAVFDWYARALTTGDWTVPAGENDPEIRTTPYFRPPGHAYYMAAIYFVTNGSYLAVRIINMLLGMAAILLIYRLGKRLFNGVVGLLAAGLMATYWGFIFWEGELNDPCLFVFLGLCLMHVLLQWAQRPRASWAALAGLITGAYALMRPNILLFGPFMAAWMLYLLYRAERPDYRRIAARAMPSWAALLIATAAVITPVAVRNYAASGEFVPISTYFGENFLIGNDADSDGITPWTPYLQELEGTGNWSCWVYVNVVKGLGRQLGIPDMKHAAASDYFFNRTIDFIKANPGRTLKLAIKKAVLFWTPIEITCNKVIQCEKGFYAPLKFLPGFALVMALFAAGAAWLLYDLVRGRIGASPGRDVILLLLAFITVYYLSFIPFFVNGRARVPIIPFCILLGAYGLWRAYQLAFPGGRIHTAAAAGAGLCYGVLLVLASIQYIPVEPDRARWYYQRAESSVTRGDYDRAIEEGKRMVEVGGAAAYMNDRLARWFDKAGRFDDAVRHFEAAMNDHPEAEYVRYNYANALADQGRVDDAVKLYEEALRINPQDAHSHNNLGMLLAGRDDVEGARRHFEAAIAAKPGLTLARRNLSELLAGQGLYREAVEQMREVVRLEPEQQDYHYTLAVRLAGAGLADEAIEEYKTALGMNPGDARAHNNIGLLFAGKNMTEEALRHYQEALRLVPDFLLAQANLANLQADLGNMAEAERLYRDAIGQKPDDAGLRNGLGYIYARQHKNIEAIREYTEALRLAPDYARVYNNLGDLYLEQSDQDAALAQYRKAVEAAPRDPLAYQNIAQLLMRQGDFAGAAESYKQALERAPRDAVIATDLANALVRSVRFDEAIRYYKTAIELDPKLPSAHCNLGIVLGVMGDKQAAIEHLRKALELDPRQPVAQKELEKLLAQ